MNSVLCIAHSICKSLAHPKWNQNISNLTGLNYNYDPNSNVDSRTFSVIACRKFTIVGVTATTKYICCCDFDSDRFPTVLYLRALVHIHQLLVFIYCIATFSTVCFRGQFTIHKSTASIQNKAVWWAKESKLHYTHKTVWRPSQFYTIKTMSS